MGNLGMPSVIGAGGGLGSLSLPPGGAPPGAAAAAASATAGAQGSGPSVLRAGAPMASTSAEGLAVEELPQSSQGVFLGPTVVGPGMGSHLVSNASAMAPPGQVAGQLGTASSRLPMGGGGGMGGQGDDGSGIPLLSDIALRALALNFDQASNPDLSRLDPKFALAISSVLPLDLDPCKTARFVHDEDYWKRVCLVHRGWRNCRLEEHGHSWKQLYFERAVAEALQAFGREQGVTAAFEKAMVRPPIDASHPAWKATYPKGPVEFVDPVDEVMPPPPVVKKADDGEDDGGKGKGKGKDKKKKGDDNEAPKPKAPPKLPPLPFRERFCKYGTQCDAVRIARTPNSGWPALESLKPLVIPSVEEHEGKFAWAQVDRTRAFPQGRRPGEEAGEAGAGGPASGAGADGKDGGGEGKESDPGDDAVSRILHRIRREAEEKARQDVLDDGGNEEVECDHNVLREYLLPDELAEFALTQRWPAKRRPCICCRRSEMLAELVQLLEAAEDYVYTLRLEQLPSRLDLEIIFARLPNLCTLEMTYGANHVGMRFERGMIGMSITDAMSLAKCIKATHTVTELSLPGNVIDDDLLRMLMTGLI